MFTVFIKEIAAALCWARAARVYIAASQGWPRAGLYRAGLDLCLCP